MIKTVATNTEDFFNNSLHEITADVNRTELLHKIAHFIIKEFKNNSTVNLNFICIHNSRRSQLSQVWANYAAHFFNLKNINSFSGGTSQTSFYRNTVKTLKSVGFNFQILEYSHQNPHYSISYKGCVDPIIGFSKIYYNEHNKTPFVTITNCDKTRENCPYISDGLESFHLPYEDPKVSDNNINQIETYLKLNKQIASEIHFIFKMIKENL